MSRRVRLSLAAFVISFAAGVTIWLGPSTVLLGDPAAGLARPPPPPSLSRSALFPPMILGAFWLTTDTTSAVLGSRTATLHLFPNGTDESVPGVIQKVERMGEQRAMAIHHSVRADVVTLGRVVVPVGPGAELVIAKTSDPDALVCIEHPPTPEGLRVTCVTVRAVRQWMLAPWANRP